MTNTGTAEFQLGGKHYRLSFPSKDDHIANVVRSTGSFYESEMLADVRSRLFYPECAVDVGAHVGNHTVYFASVLALRTVAFEPNPVSFQHLTTNVANNDVVDRCVLHQTAVGSASARGRLLSGSSGNSGMARIEIDPAGEVKIVTLDATVLSEPRIDILKIDVEGAELDVLKGAAKTLARHRPIVYVEVAKPNHRSVETYFSAARYACWKCFNASPTFLYLPRERLGQDAPAL